MTGRCGLYSEREFRPRIYSVRLLRVVPCLDTMTYRRLASGITRAYDTSLNELRESPGIDGGVMGSRIPGGRWRFSRYDRHAFGHRIESMDLSGRTTFTVKQSNGSGGLTRSSRQC